MNMRHPAKPVDLNWSTSGPRYGLVNPFYEMDPKTEDIVFDGTRLKNGMNVLIASAAMRAQFDFGSEELAPVLLDLALERNRWCIISHVTIDNDAVFPLVRFIATYPDGTKRKRVHGIHQAWLVKLDSIPQSAEEESTDAPNESASEQIS
jgi:hypothetical protein